MYVSKKSELIHLLPVGSQGDPKSTITIEGQVIQNSTSIKLRGIVIVNRLFFKTQAHTAAAKTHNILPRVQRLAFARGASILILHHVATTLLIPTLLWGSAVQLTGASHLVDNLNLNNLKIAILITNLPSWTRRDKLQATSSLPPLQAFLDSASREYGLQLMRSPDNCPNKTILRKCKSIENVTPHRVRDSESQGYDRDRGVK